MALRREKRRKCIQGAVALVALHDPLLVTCTTAWLGALIQPSNKIPSVVKEPRSLSRHLSQPVHKLSIQLCTEQFGSTELRSSFTSENLAWEYLPVLPASVAPEEESLRERVDWAPGVVMCEEIACLMA